MRAPQKNEASNQAPSTRISDDNKGEDKQRMKIKLEAWAARQFDPPPSIRTLRAWAKSGMIFPAPVKVGRTYMVDGNAEYSPLSPLSEVDLEGLSDRAKKIYLSGL